MLCLLVPPPLLPLSASLLPELEKRKPGPGRLMPPPLPLVVTLLVLLPPPLQAGLGGAGAGQNTNSLGIPSCPGRQLTPEPVSLHSAPSTMSSLFVHSSGIIVWRALLSGITCSVTQTPVLLCSDSSPGLYFTRQPSPPAHTPKLFANPPHCSPN